MWRDWREITKSYLKSGILHEFNWRYPETEQYSAWVKKEMVTNIQIFDGFLTNHGIIKIRDMYLNSNISSHQEEVLKGKRILIIPVAAPGVGKSTISRVLSRLLDDNLNKRTQDFTKYVVESLIYNSIVIADRNNHLIKQRKELIQSCKLRFPDIAFNGSNLFYRHFINATRHLLPPILGKSLMLIPHYGLSIIAFRRNTRNPFQASLFRVMS